MLFLDTQAYSRFITSEEKSAGDQQEEKESTRTVGKEDLADRRLQWRSGETECQNKKNIRQTKRKKSQKGRKSVRIGRWKVKRDDTAIE